MIALLFALLSDAGGKVPFGKDYDAALAKAKERGVPVLLYFWCDWSPYCPELDKGALSDEAVVKAAEEFVPVIVDVSKDSKRLREKFKVRFAPTLLFVDAGEKILDEHRDTWEAERVLKTFRYMARRHGRAFWCKTPAEALDLGKKERKLVVVWSPAKDSKDEAPEKQIREAMGDDAWKFLWVAGDPADAASFTVLNPDSSKSVASLPGVFDDLKSKLLECHKAWKK